MRFTVLIGLAGIVVCGVAVFFTHRAAHGRTAEERAAYESGEKAGEQAPRDAKLPTDAELNMIAQKYFEQQGSSDDQLAIRGSRNAFLHSDKRSLSGCSVKYAISSGAADGETELTTAVAANFRIVTSLS